MKGKTMNNIFTILVPLALGGIAAVIVYSGLAGKNLPLISGMHGTLIALLVVGFAMCAFGIMQVAASGRWVSPLAIIGYLLGAVLLAIMIASIAGWKLPLIQSDTQAVNIVSTLIAVKFVIGTAGFFFHLL